ncbi:hypothetical protein pb186bvf_010079 [Paramecium bursaria]
MLTQYIIITLCFKLFYKDKFLQTFLNSLYKSKIINKMKICSVIIQNKRGQNIFVVSANDYSHEDALRYSKDIYNKILSLFKSGKKVDKSFVLDSQYVCVCNVTKEAIIIVIVNQKNLFLGYESTKKLSEFFSKNYKLDITTRKYQEMLLLLDEFIYTKELIVQRLQFNLLKPNTFSSRSIADCEHLSKFTNQSADIERNLIANIPLKYAKKQQMLERVNDLINKNMKDFELPAYEIRQESQGWIQKYKNAYHDFAFKQKTKTIQKENIYKKYQVNTIKKNQIVKGQLAQQCMSISSTDIQIMKSKFQGQQIKATGFQEMYNQYQNNQLPKQPQPIKTTMNLMGLDDFTPVNNKLSVSQSSIQKAIPKPSLNDLLDLDYKPQVFSPQQQQNTTTDLSFISFSPSVEVQLKMLEKMIFMQKDGKLKEIKMFGQIALEGDFNDDQANLQLLGQGWLDPGCQRRITPNSIELITINEHTYKMPIKQHLFKAPKGIIDYIIPIKCFNQSKVPIVFIYKLEVQPSFSSFCLQFKVNEAWKTPLFDLEIEVNLEKDLEFEDIKANPQAIIQDTKILWKTKTLQPQYKGKIVLNLQGIKNQNNKLLSYIRLSVKSNTSIVEDMDCLMFYNVQEYKCTKRLAIEYKILPNS